MKDFESWSKKKTEIHYKHTNKLYGARDIWWCSLGINIGDEEDGKDVDFQRPVLILKGLGKNTCLIVPLTTSDRLHPLRVDIGSVAGKQAKGLLSQIKVIDTKRLINKIAVVNTETFDRIRKTIRDLF